jgi:hypothetical protein
MANLLKTSMPQDFDHCLILQKEYILETVLSHEQVPTQLVPLKRATL